MADYIIFNPSVLKYKIDSGKLESDKNKSVVVEIIEQRKALYEESNLLVDCLRSHDLLSGSNKMKNDLFFSNPLSKCFEFEH